jgi:hypothetical protein
MDRSCPKEIFQEAHNGLNLFLNEYPYMDEEQRAKIAKLVEHFSQPRIRQGIERRPGMLCKVAPGGVLLIAPHFSKIVKATVVESP